MTIIFENVECRATHLDALYPFQVLNEKLVNGFCGHQNFCKSDYCTVQSGHKGSQNLSLKYIILKQTLSFKLDDFRFPIFTHHLG